MGGGGATGLDMTAALGLAQARGCDMELFASVLPDAERAIIAQGSEEDEGEDIETDWNKEVGE